MCLETLKDVKEIGGFTILRMDEVKQLFPECIDEFGNINWYIFDRDIKHKYNITIHDKRNIISFTLQNGPIKEVGINGCQIDTIIEAAKVILEGLNKQLPSRENACAITKLDEALLWLMKRKIDREKRGVEGVSKA